VTEIGETRPCDQPYVSRTYYGNLHDRSYSIYEVDVLENSNREFNEKLKLHRDEAVREVQ
jgi:hypothetical protein